MSVRAGTSRLLVVAVLLLAVAVAGCGESSSADGPKIVVLGMDGLDYELTRELMAQGRLPNFSRLAESGTFRPLETSVPPQSPVAWSNFITGMDAGGHGIYDFIHRDPATMIPFLSTTRTEEPDRTLTLGDWQIPLTGGGVELLRRGMAFWEVLDRRGIPSTVIRIPANFPPSGSAHRELSGMGTPDLTGTPGTFTLYTDNMAPWRGRSLSGGRAVPVDVVDHVVEASLIGPDNPFRVEGGETTADFTVYLDPEEPRAKIEVGGESLVLEQGEWSRWIPVDFELVPYASYLSGTCIFYLKEVRPIFQLYVSPINMDPRSPAMPISTPEGYAAHLAEEHGLYYTQGMSEDTQARKNRVLGPEEFLDQARIAGGEVIEQYDTVLSEFEEGLLFYYFGNVDMVSHMMWRSMDPDHPAYTEEDARFADVIPSLYEQMDGIVGETLERVDDDTLLVIMSDHGFTSWRRAFNLNTWLVENGYMVMKEGARRNPDIPFYGVDWSRTRAYGLGLSGLYVNLRGREKYGIVPPGERDALLQRISDRLLETVDPATGEPAVTRVYIREQTYDDEGWLEIGPDIVVGYAKGTRGSDATGLGGITDTVFSDNTSPWSGDHIMDHTTVPGILLTNRKLKVPATSLEELAASLLAEYGIEEFPPPEGGEAEEND